MLRQFLVFLHLSSVIVWVGGMFFAYFCLRPAASKVLEPHERLPLWVETFAPFFRFTSYAVALILLSGFTMLLQTGFGFAPLGWYIMAALGLAMASVFGYVYRVLYPTLRLHCDASSLACCGSGPEQHPAIGWCQSVALCVRRSRSCLVSMSSSSRVSCSLALRSGGLFFRMSAYVNR
ncbi:MAG: hypothetical protein ABI887_15940 [Burkholderiales bacterium]